MTIMYQFGLLASRVNVTFVYNFPLNWLRHIDAKRAQSAVGQVSARLELPIDPVEAALALTALREVDLDLAENLAGTADERLILETSNVEILYWDSPQAAVEVVFSASHNDDEQTVIGRLSASCSSSPRSLASS